MPDQYVCILQIRDSDYLGALCSSIVLAYVRVTLNHTCSYTVLTLALQSHIMHYVLYTWLHAGIVMVMYYSMHAATTCIIHYPHYITIYYLYPCVICIIILIHFASIARSERFCRYVCTTSTSVADMHDLAV